MGQLNANMRLILASIFALAVVVITASLQILFHFSTYIALAICIITAVIFFWMVNVSD